MAETPEARAKRLAEVKRVEDFYAKKRAEREASRKKQTKAAPTATQKRNAAAKQRRDAVVKKAAPTGYQRLLQALGW